MLQTFPWDASPVPSELPAPSWLSRGARGAKHPLEIPGFSSHARGGLWEPSPGWSQRPSQCPAPPGEEDPGIRGVCPAGMGGFHPRPRVPKLGGGCRHGAGSGLSMVPPRWMRECPFQESVGSEGDKREPRSGGDPGTVPACHWFMGSSCSIGSSCALRWNGTREGTSRPWGPGDNDRREGTRRGPCRTELTPPTRPRQEDSV